MHVSLDAAEQRRGQLHAQTCSLKCYRRSIEKSASFTARCLHSTQRQNFLIAKTDFLGLVLLEFAILTTSIFMETNAKGMHATNGHAIRVWVTGNMGAHQAQRGHVRLRDPTQERQIDRS
jgi:hypothetical protein